MLMNGNCFVGAGRWMAGIGRRIVESEQAKKFHRKKNKEEKKIVVIIITHTQKILFSFKK